MSARREGKTTAFLKRVDIVKRLDVDAFRELIKTETGETMTHDVALIALHKCRCAWAQSGAIDKTLGAESGRWLAERDMWHGVRWWLL